ncbi:glycosyltransferase [Pseudomonas shirazensis]
MKILQIINNLETGGAEKLLVEIIPLFVKKNVKMDLLMINQIDSPFLKQLTDKNCCEIYSLGFKSLYNPLNIFKIAKYFKSYDIIHVHLFPAQYWVVLAKIITFSKVKLIFTEHSTSNKRIQNRAFIFFERTIYHHYSKVICITQEVKNVLESHIGLSDKYVVIENGVNLENIHLANPLTKSEIHPYIDENDKLLIQVSAFRKEKDQITLIKALQYLSENVKLILVGDGLLRHQNETMVKKMKLEHRVFFLGTRMNVPQLLKTADISILSSHWEGFGLVAVEGMAAGKPVIASNVAGLSNVVNGSGVLFEKGNEKQLGQKIKELLDNNNLYNEVAKRCYERSKQYDINILVKKLMNLYNDLLK